MTSSIKFGLWTALLTLLAVTAPQAFAAKQSAAQIEQIKQQVIDLEARRCAAIAAGDFDALANLLADDYMHVLGNGMPLDKAAYIESVKATPRVPTRGPLTVRLYGDVAVVTGDFINRMQAAGQPERVVDAYATQVARKINGQWKFEQFQHSQKQDARPPQPAKPTP